MVYTDLELSYNGSTDANWRRNVATKMASKTRFADHGAMLGRMRSLSDPVTNDITTGYSMQFQFQVQPPPLPFQTYCAT
jgi:hypothetical protein